MTRPLTSAQKASALRAPGVDEFACLVDFGVDDARVLEGVRHLPALRDSALRVGLEGVA